MSGFPVREKLAPFATRLERNGANDVWAWQVLVGDQRVKVEIHNAVLRTVAARATRNRSGRASQGGITARVVRGGEV